MEIGRKRELAHSGPICGESSAIEKKVILWSFMTKPRDIILLIPPSFQEIYSQKAMSTFKVMVNV